MSSLPISTLATSRQTRGRNVRLSQAGVKRIKSVSLWNSWTTAQERHHTCLSHGSRGLSFPQWRFHYDHRLACQNRHLIFAIWEGICRWLAIHFNGDVRGSCPHLPGNRHSFQANILTPSSFGWKPTLAIPPLASNVAKASWTSLGTPFLDLSRRGDTQTERFLASMAPKRRRKRTMIDPPAQAEWRSIDDYRAPIMVYF
jgi:hypothetical protein